MLEINFYIAEGIVGELSNLDFINFQKMSEVTTLQRVASL